MDGDGSFDPAELPPLLRAVPTADVDLALGRRRPVSRGVWPWHARARQRARRVGGCAGVRLPGTRPRADAGLPPRGPARARRPRPPLRLPARAAPQGHPRRLAARRVRREPTARGPPAPGRRSAARCAGRRAPPATSGRCWRHEGAGGRQGARGRTGEDAARRGDRHGGGSPRRRGGAARHAGRLPLGVRPVPPRARRRPARRLRGGRAPRPPGGAGSCTRSAARASASVWPRPTPTRRVPGPTVQIGMDTPQVTARRPPRRRRGLGTGDAVLGPAADGGWWVLGSTGPAAAAGLAGVPMSRPDTCRRTRDALVGRRADGR